MKRLVALMLAVAVCLSVVGVAMAEDGQPGKCMHSHTEIGRRIIRYEPCTSTKHAVISSIQLECTLCGDISYLQSEDYDDHCNQDDTWYNYHLGDYHYFYQLCVCGTRVNQSRARCPGGDKHIGFMGLPPVVLEVK